MQRLKLVAMEIRRGGSRSRCTEAGAEAKAEAVGEAVGAEGVGGEVEVDAKVDAEAEAVDWRSPLGEPR